MNTMTIPEKLRTPILWVSILIPSFNTKRDYIKDCLNSILNQNGWFGIELVWCNDGSDKEHSCVLEEELIEFMNRSRFIKLNYHKNITNVGISECLHYGLLQCNHELIFRMDSDDIMVVDRLKIQIEFMNDNKDAVICGGGIQMFDETGNKRIVHHPNVFLENFYKDMKQTWIMNHPTLCYKKSAILSVGNYEKTITNKEDYNLEIKILHKFGILHNLPLILVHYRIHNQQITLQKEICD